MNNKTKRAKVEKVNLSDKIDSYWEVYGEYSNKASNIGRQLAFSEGAVFWLMYLNMDTNPPKLILSIFYSVLIIYFISDLVQYLYCAFKFKEKAVTLRNVIKQNKGKKLEYQYPDEFIKPLNTFYIVKFLILSLSTILLIVMFVLFVNNPA